MWAVKYEAKCEETMGTHMQNPLCSVWAQIQPWVLMVAAHSKMLGFTAGPACRVRAQRSLLGSPVLGSVSSMPRRKTGVSKLRMRDLSPLGTAAGKERRESKKLMFVSEMAKIPLQVWIPYAYKAHSCPSIHSPIFSLSSAYLKAQLVCVTSDMIFHYTWLLLYKILKKREAISSTLLTQKCKTIL